MGTTDKGEAKQQTIVVGPVAAFESIKMLGTNGGGFYGMNSAHPFENPTGLSNFFNTPGHDDLPVRAGADVRPDARPDAACLRHFFGHVDVDGGTIVWSVYFDTLKPNPGLTGHPWHEHLKSPAQRRRAGNGS